MERKDKNQGGRKRTTKTKPTTQSKGQALRRAGTARRPEYEPSRKILRANGGLYRQLFQVESDALFVLDKETAAIEDLNHAAVLLYGYSRDDMLKMNAIELSAESDKSSSTISDTSGFVPLRYHRKKDGTVFPVEITFNDFTPSNRTLRIAAVRDITRRKRAEQALLESEEKHRLLFENMGEGFSLHEIITDANGKVVDFRFLAANTAYERHTGLHPQFVVGKTMREIMPQADLSQIENYGKIALAGGSQTFEYYSEAFSRHLRVHAFSPKYRQFATIFEDITSRKRAEEALRENEEKYTLLFDQSATPAVMLKLPEAIIVDTNTAFEKLTGYTKQETLGKTAVELGISAPQERERILSAFKERGSLSDIETQIYTKAGEARRVVVNINPLMIRGQSYAISTSQDITEHKKAESQREAALDALRASEEKLRLVLENSYDGINLLDLRTGKYVLLNSSQVKMTGFDAQELEQMTDLEASDRVFPEDREISVEQKKRLAAGEEAPVTTEYRWKVKSGEYRWFSDTRTIVRDAQGQPIALVGISRDITERKQAELDLLQANKVLVTLHERLREQATRDALTGLYNRRYLYETIERELARAKRENYPVSVAMIDIDHFKNFNDTHGHQAGDEILIGMGNLLQNSIRQGDMACRYGGEEFVLIMPGAHMEDAARRVEEIRRNFQGSQIEINGHRLSSTISAGIALYPDHGDETNHIIKAADLALYQAKEAGRNCVRSAMTK